MLKPGVPRHESRHRRRPPRLGLQDRAPPAQGGRGRRTLGADCHLSFESARILFSELTPARIDLLEALRQCGPCSVYALAKETGRNYSNVHTDVAKLEEHGLVQRTPEDAVFVPFESVEIHLSLFRQAA